MAVAQREGAGWRVAAPRPVGDVTRFLAQLRAEAAGGAVALGIDMPLGVPRAYAAIRPEADFPAFLRELAARRGFFDVCAALTELGPERPFYPARGVAGITRAAHAAAIAGWRDMLLPALAAGEDVRLWPFAGPFRTLLAPGAVALAETYPAEALRHLGIRLAGSKRRQSDRAAVGAGLLAAMTGLGGRPDATLADAAADGFGADATGEDRFDCVLGLLCVLNVLAGIRPDTAPDDPWIRRWEVRVSRILKCPERGAPRGDPRAFAQRKAYCPATIRQSVECR